MRDAGPGLFGPGSVTWQMHSDPVMWIAGLRPLHLQAPHRAPSAASCRTATSARTPGAG